MIVLFFLIVPFISNGHQAAVISFDRGVVRWRRGNGLNSKKARGVQRQFY